MIDKRLIFIILIIVVFIIILYTNTFSSNNDKLIENIKVLKGPNIYGFDKKIELTI